MLVTGVTGGILVWNPLAHTLLAGRLDVHAPEDPEHRWQPWHPQARPVPAPDTRVTGVAVNQVMSTRGLIPSVGLGGAA